MNFPYVKNKIIHTKHGDKDTKNDNVVTLTIQYIIPSAEKIKRQLD